MIRSTSLDWHLVIQFESASIPGELVRMQPFWELVAASLTPFAGPYDQVRFDAVRLPLWKSIFSRHRTPHICLQFM